MHLYIRWTFSYFSIFVFKGSMTNNVLYDDRHLEFTAGCPGRNNIGLHTGINEIIISEMLFHHDVEYWLQTWELKSSPEVFTWFAFLDISCGLVIVDFLTLINDLGGQWTSNVSALVSVSEKVDTTVFWICNDIQIWTHNIYHCSCSYLLLIKYSLPLAQVSIELWRVFLLCFWTYQM